MFHLREKVIGSKKTGTVPTVIKDPDTNKEEDSPTKIKQISVKYVKNLLTNSRPKQGFEEDIEMKRALHNKRMNESIEDDEPLLSRGWFEKT